MKISQLISKYRNIAIYLVILELELTLIRNISDLKPGTSNWISKAQQIIDFKVPTDNFYGPGAALLITPFVYFGIQTYFANYLYFALGAVAYWAICAKIQSRRGKYLALMALPTNFYLIWLIDSSQDTVFEFFLLTCSMYFLIQKRHGYFAIFCFILCCTRAGYWIFFLGVSALLFIHSAKKRKKICLRKLFAFYFLIATSIFNFYNYDSPSPALEGGITAYFSYAQYHYLALPKMDMDVFLSGPNGAFSEQNVEKIGFSGKLSEINSQYQKAAISSAVNNKKETLLGWMQKFDSYFFDVQKIPHLPGRYVLDQKAKVIEIREERLTWNLVIGNLLHLVYRTTFLLLGLIGIGLWFAVRMFKQKNITSSLELTPLALPYLFGVVPGILIYTETRFKIVAEILLVPLIIEIWIRVLQGKNRLTRSTFDDIINNRIQT